MGLTSTDQSDAGASTNTEQALISEAKEDESEGPAPIHPFPTLPDQGIPAAVGAGLSTPVVMPDHSTIFGPETRPPYPEGAPPPPPPPLNQAMGFPTSGTPSMPAAPTPETKGEIEPSSENPEDSSDSGEPPPLEDVAMEGTAVAEPSPAPALSTPGIEEPPWWRLAGRSSASDSDFSASSEDGPAGKQEPQVDEPPYLEGAPPPPPPPLNQEVLMPDAMMGHGAPEEKESEGPAPIHPSPALPDQEIPAVHTSIEAGLSTPLVMPDHSPIFGPEVFRPSWWTPTQEAVVSSVPALPEPGIGAGPFALEEPLNKTAGPCRRHATSPHGDRKQEAQRLRQRLTAPLQRLPYHAVLRRRRHPRIGELERLPHFVDRRVRGKEPRPIAVGFLRSPLTGLLPERVSSPLIPRLS